MLDEEIIRFAMYLTGHDRDTIVQMYNDFLNKSLKNTVNIKTKL